MRKNTVSLAKRQHTTKIIDALQARLAELELDAAQLGYDAPPHIATEMSNIRSELEKQDAALKALEVFDALNDASEGVKLLDRRDESNYEHRLNVMVATVMATVAEVSSVKRLVMDQVAEVKLLIYRVAVGFAICYILLVGVVLMWEALR